MATITISHEELFKLLNMMKPFVKTYTKKKAMGIMLEVSIEKGVLFMSIPNCTMNANCETTGTGKFSMQYLYFYDIIKTTKSKPITIEIVESKIIIGQTSFRVLT
ncbi:MAG: hypothetical protein Q7U47_15115 [Paludibacter sp.]|nr:hypothetical protein [Paludibacter sp.]